MQSTPLEVPAPQNAAPGPVFCQHRPCKDVASQPREATGGRTFCFPEKEVETQGGAVTHLGSHGVLVRVNEKKNQTFLPDGGPSPMARERTLVPSCCVTLCNCLNHPGTQFLHL